MGISLVRAVAAFILVFCCASESLALNRNACVPGCVSRALRDATPGDVPYLPGPSSGISPDGLAETNLPGFAWSFGPDVEEYLLTVSGEGTVISNWLAGTTWTPASELANGKYEWRIKTRNRNGDGPWSDYISFEIVDSLSNMSGISVGQFQMGDNSGAGNDDESPVHMVFVSDFFMDSFEVTNEKMRRTMQWAYDHGKIAANPVTVENLEGDPRELLNLDSAKCELSFVDGQFLIDEGREDHPCVEITWYGAVAFCNYRSDMLGLERCYSFDDWSCDYSRKGCRLPTEAEWEKACRAGSPDDYCFGDSTLTLTNYAWFSENAEGTSHPVGQKTPNSWGLYDMHGNVGEWCADYYAPYSSDYAVNPTGPAAGVTFVNRGGCWYYGAERCRSSYRNLHFPAFSGYFMGLRTVRVPYKTVWKGSLILVR